MDDNTPLNRTDRILKALIWLGLGVLALIVVDILYLENALLGSLFNS